jgi:hypothetical protein
VALLAWDIRACDAALLAEEFLHDVEGLADVGIFSAFEGYPPAGILVLAVRVNAF